MAEIDAYDLAQIWSEGPEAVGFACETDKLIYDYSDSPEGYGSLDCAGIYQLDLDTYYSFSAWADTTGWGCRDGVDWFGPFSSVRAAADALSQEERRRLGFEHGPEHKDLFRE